ncbi:MAG: hypothetical protein R2795_25915 [Saprospiraceae bacterium]
MRILYFCVSLQVVARIRTSRVSDAEGGGGFATARWRPKEASR